MRSILAGVLALALLCAGPVRADTITFGGSILDSCSLALSSGGTLAMSQDGTTMGSEEGAGQPAHLTILSTGSHTVNVGAPTVVSSPAGYQAGSQQVEVAYQGQSLLSAVSQAYTTSATSFPVATVALSTLTMNNRIVNPQGFASGSYATQTVVTCN
jgi:hypothetical protein